MKIPDRKWTGTPGSLLRADYAIVPFHGRDSELSEWSNWVLDDSGPVVRLLTGSGGMGKTRLARELCLHLHPEGILCGFVDLTEIDECLAYLKTCPNERTLLVVDYAETAEDAVADILRIIVRKNLTLFRVLLIARGAGYWWSRLKRMGNAVGDLLSHDPEKLRPLAMNIETRRASYNLANTAFAMRLGVPSSDTEPPDLADSHYERALLLHMSALLAVQGVQAQGMDSILDQILQREIRYWAMQIKTRRLPQELEPGFERVMGVISAYGGVRDKNEAVGLIGRVRFFESQPRAVIEAVADTLHDCYPGPPWIEPIQPDLFMEYLVTQARKIDPDNFDNILLP